MQTRIGSFVESCVNIGLGYGVAILSQVIVFPLFGIHVSLRRALCWVMGHQYRILRTFTPVSRQVGCRRCGQRWAMHDEVRALVEWSGEFEQMYRDHGQWEGEG